MSAGVVLLGTGTLPASATYLKLCTGYASCKATSYSHFGYEAAAKTAYWRMATGHNCTNYVAYRLVRNGMPNIRPWAGTGNAYNWGIANKAITNSTPKVGAVAWWGANQSPIGKSGHVAYVERVVSSTEIITSEDNWGGNFHWRRVTKTHWPTGFIHFRQSAPGKPPATQGASPKGMIDRAWTPTPGRVSVTGWAFDPDATSKSVSMTVSIGGVLGAKGAEQHVIGAANWPNKEVGTAHPGVGNNHGKYSTVTTKLRGARTVYLYASNISGTPGGRVLLGTKTVRIASPDPRGKVTLTSSPKAGQLRVQGWAVDPNALTKPSTVRAYIGGPIGKGHRVSLGVAALSRSDVAKAVPGAGKKHGFDKTVKTKWTGKRTVYVYGVNLTGTPGATTLIGKATLTIKK
ncbi:MAG TPA: CHAP domain-containing protein [Propionibacteriaceae bacterium]